MCFFWHRKIEGTEELKIHLESVIVNLIENENVKIFLFGSKSDFDFIYHAIVTKLKNKYPQIQRNVYTCQSETCVLEKERVYWEEIYSHFIKKPVTLLGVEKEIEHKTKYRAGRASYVERNQAMIDDSDFCVFYYNKNYITPTKTNSGTKIAYEYAVRKKKKVINFFNVGQMCKVKN